MSFEQLKEIRLETAHKIMEQAFKEKPFKEGISAKYENNDWDVNIQTSAVEYSKTVSLQKDGKPLTNAEIKIVFKENTSRTQSIDINTDHGISVHHDFTQEDLVLNADTPKILALIRRSYDNSYTVTSEDSAEFYEKQGREIIPLVSIDEFLKQREIIKRQEQELRFLHHALGKKTINDEKTAIVGDWLIDCFDEKIAINKRERCDRFLEEALELVQSLHYKKEDIPFLVDYVYSRPAGEPAQEVGGVTTTLSALCYGHKINLNQAAQDELDRINKPEIKEKIRIKQKNKPKNSPLPQ